MTLTVYEQQILWVPYVNFQVILTVREPEVLPNLVLSESSSEQRASVTASVTQDFIDASRPSSSWQKKNIISTTARLRPTLLNARSETVLTTVEPYLTYILGGHLRLRVIGTMEGMPMSL